jgi:polysaccharide export outer membrane protein
MRAPRLLLLSLFVALHAAGCARPPLARAPVAPVAVAAAPGIDNVVYGSPVPAAAPRPIGGPVVPAALAPAPVAYAEAAEGPYTLDSGDRLRIVVFGQEGLTNSYAVDAGGHIAMPLIGSVAARGLTTDALSRRVADRLRQGFIREPHVAVEIEAYRPFFILGEVTAPGQYPYVANMTVETAVAIAGGFTPRGYRRQVMISRNVEGRIVRFQVPVNCPIRPGDTVVVDERWF